MIQKIPSTQSNREFAHNPRRGKRWLLNEQQLHELLLRERLRCDRSGAPLAVIAMRPEKGNSRDLHRLSVILRRRLRYIDEAGKVDRQTIVVVLPLTDSQGARRVAEDVAAAFTHRGGKLSCEIFVYPDDNDSGNVQQPEDRRRTDSHSLAPIFVQPLPLWKRGLDILGACIGVLLTWPILLAAAIAIKVTSRGPVFFRQQRAGLGGRPFWLYKLRTMVADAEQHQAELRSQSEQDGPAFKMKNDPRVTAVGRFLRRTCIDELPQLFNVLRGEMTLVGPRPLPCDEADACQKWQKRRTDVTPGLTCIWQAAGGHRVADFNQWMRMDLQYVASRSLRCDTKLLLKTAWKVVRLRGSC